MFPWKVLPLALLLNVGSVLGVQDSFLLTQCECLADFVSIPTGQLLSNLESSGVECPVDATTGFIRDFGLGEGGFSFSIPPDFFIDDAGERNTWFMFFDVSMEEAVAGETYRIGDFGFPNPFSVDFVFEDTIFVTITGTSSQSFPIQRNDEDRYQIFVYEANVFVENTGDINSVLAVDLVDNFIRSSPVFTSENAQLNSITGNVEDFVEDVNINLLDGENQGKILLKMIAISDEANGLLDLPETAVLNIVDLVNGFPDVDVGALPVLDTDFTIETNEDVAIDDGSIGDALVGSDVPLDILFDEELLNGVIDDFDGSTGDFVSYTPAANDFGEDILRLTYSAAEGELPYDCSLTVDVTIDITAVEDIPVVRVIEPLIATAFVDVVFNIPVADSVDFPDDDNILQVGFVVIVSLPEQGTLKLADCVTPINLNEAIDIVDGLFNFCFEGVILGGGDDQAFTFNVLPPSGNVENQAVDLGTITFTAASPIAINLDSNTRSLTTTEDVEVTLEIDSETFFNVDPGFDGVELEFGITILSLPDANVGSIVNVNGDAIAVNDVFPSEEQIRFIPAANFSNANAQGGVENEDGDIVFLQDCEDDERVGEVCPDIFSYALVFFNDEQDGTGFDIADEANFGIVVTAVNDEEPAIITSPLNLIVQFDNNEEVQLIFVSSDEFEVANDNGENVFRMGVRFVGNNGGVIQSRETVETDPQVVGFNSAEDADNDVNNNDCLAVGCPVVEVIGTPGRVNAFLSELQFGSPNEADAEATVSVVLSGDGEEFGEPVEDIEIILITNAPTGNPTRNPTVSPTLNPTVSPTLNPTVSPTLNPTLNPTVSPTLNPTLNPTVSPTLNPTLNPTVSPTLNPTVSPTLNPTLNPTVSPTLNPTLNPTVSPTLNPTVSPTLNPTLNPTVSPTLNPTVSPTLNPTVSPTLNPTVSPTLNPTVSPTLNPTVSPTLNPTLNPTVSPTITIEVDNNELEAGLIGGIVAGAVVFLGLLVVVPIVLGKRQENIESAAENEKEAYGNKAKIEDEV